MERLLIVLLVSGSVVLGPCPARATELPSIPRILIIGDSITAGGSGDWTWRYRLWKSLEADGVASDFLGSSDTVGTYGDGGPVDYVDPAFDRDHEAIGGRPWSRLPMTGQEVVATYAPDVVMVMLGANDLIFYGGSPESIRADAVAFVRDLQAADPDVDAVIGEVTPFAWADVTPTNAGLADLPAELATTTSQVVLARTSAGYVYSRDTYDEVHPSATGEVIIAAAMEDALAELGVGEPALRPLAQVVNGPRLAPTLEASADPQSREVRLAWRNGRGAEAYFVWMREAGAGWVRFPQKVSGSGVVIGEVDLTRVWELRVQPTKGRYAAAEDAWSNVVTVGTRPTAAPATVPATSPTPTTEPAPTLEPEPVSVSPPRRTRVRVRADGRTVVTWRAGRGAERYQVQARLGGVRGWVTWPSQTSRRRVLGHLDEGRYVLRVVAISAADRATGRAVRFRVRPAQL